VSPEKSVTGITITSHQLSLYINQNYWIPALIFAIGNYVVISFVTVKMFDSEKHLAAFVFFPYLSYRQRSERRSRKVLRYMDIPGKRETG
jgi:hypothetical protein